MGFCLVFLYLVLFWLAIVSVEETEREWIWGRGKVMGFWEKGRMREESIFNENLKQLLEHIAHYDL